MGGQAISSKLCIVSSHYTCVWPHTRLLNSLVLWTEAKMNSWHTENTYPTSSCSHNNKLDGLNQFFLGAHPQQNEIKERKPMIAGRSQPRQPGASHLKGAARQKGCKNLSQAPTRGWLLAWEPSGSGHTAEQGKQHCVLHLSVLSWPRTCFSLYCSCRTLTHGAETLILSSQFAGEGPNSSIHQWKCCLSFLLVPAPANILDLQQLILHDCPFWPQTPTYLP